VKPFNFKIMALEINDIIVENTLTVGGLEVGSASYFYQKIQDNAINTPIPVQNTFYSITGTRINTVLNNFTAGAGALTYTGSVTRKFLVNAVLTWEAGSTLFHLYTIGIFKNGVIDGYLTGALDNSTGYPRNIALTGIVELATNDTIELRVTDTDGDQDLLVINMLFNAVSV